MVSVVGTVKREIAFHGDVLNTAAKIQKECESFKKELLVTKELVDSFSENNKEFAIKKIGKSRIRGKKNMVDIFAIEKKCT